MLLQPEASFCVRSVRGGRRSDGLSVTGSGRWTALVIQFGENMGNITIQLFSKLDYTAMGLTPTAETSIQEFVIPKELYEAIHARGMFDAFNKLQSEFKPLAERDHRMMELTHLLRRMRDRWMEEVAGTNKGMVKITG